MEISPILMAKMLLIAILFGAQSGIIFDAGRGLRALLFGEVKSPRLKRLYGVKNKFSGRSLCESGKRSALIFKYIIIFLCDFLWALYSFFGLVMINYSYNDGGIRAFTALGVLAGFFAYYFTLSRVVRFLIEFLCFLIRFVFFAVFDTVRMPFLKIYNNFEKNIKKSFENIRFHIEKKRKKVYNVSELLYENEGVKNKASIVKISVKGSRKKTDKCRSEKTEEGMRKR